MTDIPEDVMEAAKAQVLWALQRWMRKATPEELLTAIFEAPAMQDLADRAAQAERMARLEKALKRIEKWIGEFPETGKYWDDGTPMSYGVCYGSNGERDFMRAIAARALSQEGSEPS